MRAPVFEFASDVDRRIAKLTREQYYLRTGPAKRLLEELFPLSRFALRLKFPSTEIEVEAYEDDGPKDGTIYWAGTYSSKLDVEVTCIYSYENSLRDELLLTRGSAPGAGPINRNKITGEVIATGIFPSHSEEMSDLGKSIVERFKKKCEKKYPKGTLLLIAFDDPTFFGFDLWRGLFEAIEVHGGLEGGFGEIHLINCGSNETQMVV